MAFRPLELPGLILVEPEVYRDERGFLLESYHQERYAAGGIPAAFVQDNHSASRRGVLRGLHLQLEEPQGKLIRVIRGEIWDVAVDVRVGSPTFGRHVAVVLSAENFRQLWIPPGFAHGFCVLSAAAEVEYKCTAYYRPQAQLSIRWNDPELAIPWPVKEPLLSARDRDAPPLRAVLDRLYRYEALAGPSPGSRPGGGAPSSPA